MGTALLSTVPLGPAGAAFSDGTDLFISAERSITDNVPHLGGFAEVIASGGGVRNGDLMRRLAANLPAGLSLVTSDKYGIPPQFKEAVKFATLAHATVNRMANNIPAASGASGFGILGKLVLPPRMARI